MSMLRNYASSILLLLGVFIGGVFGVFFGEKTYILKPIGQIFLNMMFVTIIPLVFFSISSSVSKTEKTDRLKKILLSTFLVFIITALLAAIFGYFGILMLDPFEGMSTVSLVQNMDVVQNNLGNDGDSMLVKTLSVSEFSMLMDKGNLLALIIFSILFGISTVLAGEKGKPMALFLSSGTEVILKLVGLVMWAAPVGLGCYFAYTIGELGSKIMGAYLVTFLIYIGLTIIYYFGFNSLYAFIAGGRLGLKVFWKNIITPSLSAISTASSAVCIPVNLIAVRRMGVPNDIGETVIPLGTNAHKDGSVIGGVLKITFLFAFMGQSIGGIENFIAIVGVALLVGIVMGAIPGGGMIAEVMICSIFGFKLEMVGIIIIVSTIIDIPATLLNSTGNVVCSMLVSRLVEGKDWLKNQMV